MDQDFEMAFHGDCTRSFGEETKQRVYMRLMGIPEVATWRSPLNYDFGGRSVIDIGGGPCSVLLKGENLALDFESCVIDPGRYPQWVLDRYFTARIGHINKRGEDLVKPWVTRWDLALVYNCLQHTDDPEKIIANARAAAKELKLFEWIDMEPCEGHPQMLTAAILEKWTGRTGRVVELRGEYGCQGRAWILS